MWSASREPLEGDRGHHDRAAVGHLRRAGCRCCRGARRRRGRAAATASWARRRTEPVATVAPGARSAQRAADERVAGVAPLRDGGQHQARRGDRGQVLGRVHGEVGPPVEHGLLDLLDEHALAAELALSGASRRRSPVRLDEHQLGPQARMRGLRAGRRRARPASGPAGCRGWRPGAAARAHARAAPGRRPGSRQVEQVAQDLGVALAPGRAGRVLQPHRRLVQQLGHDRPGEGLDGVALAVVERGRAGRGGARARPGGRPRPARAAGRRAARPGGPVRAPRSARPRRRRWPAPAPPRPAARPGPARRRPAGRRGRAG